MPSFTTVFRASVMLVAAAVAVKGWQSFGPTNAQLKAIATRAIELVQERLNQSHLQAEGASLAAVPDGFAPIHGTETTSNTPASTVPLAKPSFAATEMPAAPPVFANPPAAERRATTSSEEMPPLSSVEADRMLALMDQLKELGGFEPRLVAWGASGQLYRFCCRAALGNAHSLSRHFESVSAEPLAAVEDVVSKVAAWRGAEPSRSALR